MNDTDQLHKYHKSTERLIDASKKVDLEVEVSIYYCLVTKTSGKTVADIV